jgi:hypothetical protein
MVVAATREGARETIERTKRATLNGTGWMVIRLTNGQRILTASATVDCLVDTVELRDDDAGRVVLRYDQIAKVEAVRD